MFLLVERKGWIILSENKSETITPKNLMEELVDAKIDEIMKMENMCCCKHCRADVFALALNLLPPKYVVTTGGEVFSRLDTRDTQSQASITTAIVRAAKTVNKNSYHDKGHPHDLLPNL